VKNVLKQFEQLINSNKGASGTGPLLGKLASMAKAEGFRVMEPGNVTFREGTRTQKVIAPASYSIWYLYDTCDLIAKITDDPDSYLENNLKFLHSAVTDESEGLPGIKPLQIPTVSTLYFQPPSWQLLPGKYPIAKFEERGPWFINEMAYEIWQRGASIKYSSKFLVEGYVGYFAIPIAQLGAMESIAIVRETDIHPDDTQQPIEVTEPELFPPREAHSCYGRVLITEGYHVKQDEFDHIELLAPDFPTGVYKEDSILPKYWLRFHIHEDETFPIPGEFIAVLVKPHPIPPHPWWFQYSSPLIYSGQWVETNFLTSGIITEIIDEDDRDDDGTGDLYVVTVQGFSVKLESSDFFEYEVDDRVGIIKKANVTDEEVTEAFAWTELTFLTKEDEDKILEDYTILPIEFYQ